MEHHMEVLFFAVLIPILFLIAVAYINRCKSCGTMTYSFRKARCGDIDRGEAYLVCIKCGYKVCAGSVDETGTVLWNTGHTGVFLDDGEYKSTGHSDRNGFHSRERIGYSDGSGIGDGSGGGGE
jgi:hypothetical protein